MRHATTRTRLNVTSLEERVVPTVYVTVEAIADAAEAGGVGTFRFTRTGSTSNSLMASFSVSGTATSGTDYTALGTTVTFPVNAATVDLSVVPIGDALHETDETVAVQVMATKSSVSPGTPGSASLTIDNDEVASAPQITNFVATNLGNGLFLFTGQVVNENPSGLTITFGGGVPTMVGLTCTTASDGTFSKTVQLQTNGSDEGTVTATTVDGWGLDSNEAQVHVSP